MAKYELRQTKKDEPYKVIRYTIHSPTNYVIEMCKVRYEERIRRLERIMQEGRK